MYIAGKSASRFLKEMKFGNTRVGKALRAAVYPALEPAESKRFEAVRRKAQDARNSGDFAGAEEVYVRALAEARASSDPSQLSYLRYGLAQLYQEQKRYQEAEGLLREQLDEAMKASPPNTQVHGAHMGLARLFQEQGKVAQADEHYRAALIESEKPGLWPDREFHSATALSVAKFYVEQQRYSDAEPLYKRFVENHEAHHPSDPSLPYYIHNLAEVYEAQEKFAAAEESYRRSLKLFESLDTPKDFGILRALDALARFCQARGRYAEAEDVARRRLAIVEEKIERHTAEVTNHSRRRSDDENLEATIKHARVPISEALDRLAEIYESQDKFAESEPLRRRSVEIKEQAWREANGWIWVDSLTAHANALHKIGREHEAAKLDERVEAIRAKFPPGSFRTSLRFTSRPLKKTLRGRINTFMHALRYPSSD